MKTIYFVHLYNDYSGSPKVLKDVLSSIDERIFNVCLVTSQSDGFLSFWKGKSYKYNYRPHSNKTIMLVFYLFTQVRLFLYLLFSLNKGDLVYINTVLPFGAFLASKLKRCESIYHVHETYIKPALLMKFLMLFVRNATEVIFVSNYVSSFYKLKSHQIKSVLYNSNGFVDEVSESRDVQIGEISKETGFKCLMVCSLKKYKGIQEFINVASILSNDDDIKFTLQLSADKVDVEKFFSGSVVPKNLDILSVNNDLTRVYKNHDLLLNCTNSDECIETFGLTIIEAMSFGLPCIVPNVGGPSEIVEHGITGFCIDSKDQYTISQKILELSKDKKKYQVLSHNALLRSKCFRFDKFCKKINFILNKYSRV
ncbi:glycosyltransferase family 4 protein [Shewanella algae]